jgi:Flp pilus assembly protein TadD
MAEKRGDLPEATRQLERAAAMDAQYSHVLWHLGRIYLRQGRTEEGQKLLKRFRKMDANTGAYETALLQLSGRPNDPALHYTIAGFHLAADELPQAVVELRRVLELKPGDARARQDLIAALRRQGRLSEARHLSAAARGH